MDLGKRDYDGDGDFVRYSSEVSENPPDMRAFFERVAAWAGRAGITLGEGRLWIYPGVDNPQTIYLHAPVLSGDINAVAPDVTFPFDI